MERDAVAGGQEDSQFDLPVENELLMLKLKAEFGAECIAGTGEIPPVVVNEFLKSVYEFERRFREPRNRCTIHEKIQRPTVLPSEQLDARQLTAELQRLLKLMRDHGLELDVLGAYEERTIYDFITGELFSFEIEDLRLPGYCHHFCYEEFHPNHELDIRSRSETFVQAWLNHSLNEYSWEMSERFIHPEGGSFSKKTVVNGLQRFFRSHPPIKGEYEIKALCFDWDNVRQEGRGRVEGIIRSKALKRGVAESAQTGPFELYLSNTQSWWSVIYFVFPGFSWNEYVSSCD